MQRHEIRSDEDRQRVASAVRDLPPGKWAVEVKRLQNRRTLDQNALYWRWVHMIASETGNDADEVHDAMKKKFIAPEYVEVFGELVDRRSTADKRTGEMVEYMEKVRAWAFSTLGIALPLPEERFAA